MRVRLMPISVPQAAWEAQEDGRYREHAASLGRCVDGADALLAAATAAAAELDAVEAGAEGVRATAASLDETCNRLVSERNQLESFASELAKRLVHFDRLDRLSDAVLHMSAQRLDVNETLAAAGDLVAAIAFLRAHAHYADAQAYLSRARQVEARLLGIVRFRAQTVLQQVRAEEVQRPQHAQHVRKPGHLIARCACDECRSHVSDVRRGRRRRTRRWRGRRRRGRSAHARLQPRRPSCRPGSGLWRRST